MKLEDIKKEINNQITNKYAKIEALKRVVIKKKKDGTDFANLNRAIEGGTITKDYVSVYLDVPYHGISYSTARIPVYGYKRNLPDTDSKKENYKPSDTYIFTSDEIKEGIEKEIKSTMATIDELKEFLMTIDDIYNNIISKAQDLHSELEKVKTLHYELTDVAKKMIEFGYVY